jgi:hypothetical protein
MELRDLILKAYPTLFMHSVYLFAWIYGQIRRQSVTIAKILEIENFNFEQSISFGDGYNDEKC